MGSGWSGLLPGSRVCNRILQGPGTCGIELFRSACPCPLRFLTPDYPWWSEAILGECWEAPSSLTFNLLPPIPRLLSQWLSHLVLRAFPGPVRYVWHERYRKPPSYIYMVSLSMSRSLYWNNVVSRQQTPQNKTLTVIFNNWEIFIILQWPTHSPVVLRD